MRLINLELPVKMAAKPLLLGAVLFFIAASFSCKKAVPIQPEQTNGIAKYQYYEDVNMWNHIFAKTDAYVIPENIAPKAMIIPHHDITTGRQNSFYKAVSQEIQPSVIVIVAPDHFELGQKQLTMPVNTVFKAPDGNILIDDELIAKLSENPEIMDAVSLQDDLWFQEHGIFIHTPFLKHYFPDSKVVPVLSKMLTTDEEFEYFGKLGKVLAEVLPEDALVIASVDFSHYQIPKMTELHDSVSKNTIQNMEDPRYAEIDSPESIQVILEYAKAKNACNPILIDRSSTFDYIPDEFVESTSHQYWTFYTDDVLLSKLVFYEDVELTQQRYEKPAYGKHQTILIGGSGKTDAGIRETWKWDRYLTSQDPAEILLRAAAGKEARFFYGFDALIFDPEAGSEYKRTLHGSQLTVKTVTKLDFEKLFKEWMIPFLDDNYVKSFVRFIDGAVNTSVDVLEIVVEDPFDSSVNEQTVEAALGVYDVIVVRDNQGIVPATAYMLDPESEYWNNPASYNKIPMKKYDLGIIRGNGTIKGSLLALDFSPYGTKVELFDYESQDGVVPAIHQFIEIP